MVSMIALMVIVGSFIILIGTLIAFGVYMFRYWKDEEEEMKIYEEEYYRTMKWLDEQLVDLNERKKKYDEIRKMPIWNYEI